MRLKISILLCLLVFAGCNIQRSPSGTFIDLTKRLPYATKSDDSQVIPFGTPLGKQVLLYGWSRPSEYENETFRWGLSDRSAFSFKINKIESLYLHLKFGSFFENSAQVLLNGKTIGRIQIHVEPELYSLQLPLEAMNSDKNIVEFIWNELRLPPTPKDSPKLAAQAFFAVITPAKYVNGNPLIDLQNSVSRSSMLQVAGKKRASLILNLGGTIRYYEKLNKDSRLQFGIFYDPAAFSEIDDYADFRITLRRDGEQEQRVFQKRAVQERNSREMISLSKYIIANEPKVYEIEFHIQRNSILDSGKAAWVEPVLYQGFSEKTRVSDDAIEKIRNANKGANVIVMILDAAGAKHLPTYGYPRKTTPNIEKLVKQGVQFQRAYCQAVYTLASTATLFSGLDPYKHQVIDKDKLPEETVTLAERFLNSGYATGTFLANGNASSSFGMTQGFQEVREVYNEPNYTGWGSDITNRFNQWLVRLKGDRPFFAYIHYREPHGPFNPPASFKHYFTDPNYTRFEYASDEMRRKIRMGEISETKADRDFITASYDENLRYGDYEVERVIQKLKELNLYDHTIIIITADHGEAFWEHDFQGHNSQLYEESVHIPLIVKLSSATKLNGKRINTPVGTVDIYPALVDLLQLSRKAWNVDGHSFLPYLASAKSENVPILSQTIHEQAFSYMEGDFKYIYHRYSGAEELYDLKADPEERNNISKIQRIQAAYLRSRLFGWQTVNKRPI